MKRTVFIYLFDGFSDWEIAYLMPELKRHKEIDLFYFSIDGGVVESLGGMRVMTQKNISQIAIRPTDMLILPGGTIWERQQDRLLLPLIESCMEQKSCIAAICGATVYLANQGLLDGLKHTSNALHYLKWFAPYYKGESHYVTESAVMDQNIITASGTAPIEFASIVIKALEIYDDSGLNTWFELFKKGLYKQIL